MSAGVGSDRDRRESGEASSVRTAPADRYVGQAVRSIEDPETGTAVGRGAAPTAEKLDPRGRHSGERPNPSGDGDEPCGGPGSDHRGEVRDQALGLLLEGVPEGVLEVAEGASSPSPGDEVAVEG